MSFSRSLLALIGCCSALLLAGCDEDPCTEPDDRGEGVEGDVCVTTLDCVAGLACIGTDFMADAHCVSPTALPGGEDPGCLTDPATWVGHSSHGAWPPDIIDGCEHLSFRTNCDCQILIPDAACTPVGDLHRVETWRRCNDCCWRLISYWRDDAVCD